jgi:hypothetical protein
MKHIAGQQHSINLLMPCNVNDLSKHGAVFVAPRTVADGAANMPV